MRRSMGLVTLLLATAANPAASQPPASSASQLAGEAAASGASRSVFAVHTEYGKASGFLLDSGGIVLTDVRILRDAKRLRVQLDDSTKVAAQLLARYDRLGVAVLRVHPATCAGLPVLELALAEATSPTVEIPVWPSESGRPLLDGAGAALGMLVSTRPDTEGRPLPARLVPAAALRQPLADARKLLQKTKPPAPTRFPVVPRQLFPAAQLEAAASAEKWDGDPYRIADLKAAGRYTGCVYTPPYMHRLQLQAEADAAERLRKADEDELLDTSLYDPFARLGIRDVQRRAYAPVVTIELTPQVNPTKPSESQPPLNSLIRLVATLVAGDSRDIYVFPEYDFEFAADLVGFDLRVDGKRVEDLTRGTAWLPIEQVARGQSHDVGAVGVFVYDPRVFQPRDGAWPKVDVIIESMDTPGTWRSTQISQRTLERVALDFEPWLLEQRARGWDQPDTVHSAREAAARLIAPRTGQPCELALGMPVTRVRELLGEPPRVFSLRAGGANAIPWDAVALEYDAGRDPLYRSNRRQLVNRLVFTVANLDTVLALWELEAPAP